MDEIAIKCKGIKKTFGEGENRIQALKGVDLEIYKGELTLLVGPSGSGKSTLLSIITNILTPDDGELFLLGQNIKEMSENERAHFCQKHLGIVFQALFLIPMLTVAENIILPITISGGDEEEGLKRAEDLLRQMNLENRSHVSPGVLSRGQQQRVAIARAMINDAKIIICDEPTSALDQQNGLQIMSLLHELAKHSSRAVLVVTHDHRIFPFADRIIKLSDGQITEDPNV